MRSYDPSAFIVVRAADDEIQVGRPADHVAGVLRVDLLLAGCQVDSVHVEGRLVALVESDEECVRDDPHRDRRPGRALPWNGVNSRVLLVAELRGEEVEVLVAADVLQIEQVLVVVGPEVLADAAFLVLGDGSIVVLPIVRTQTCSTFFVVRRKVGQVLAVGRDLRAGLLRIAEEHVARNQRRQFGQRRGRNENGRGQCQTLCDIMAASMGTGETSGCYSLAGRDDFSRTTKAQRSHKGPQRRPNRFVPLCVISVPLWLCFFAEKL